MSDCIFCQIISGTIPSKKAYENDDVLVIHDIHPAAPVHLLVLSKRHYTDITEMPGDVYATYMSRVREVIKAQGVTQFRIVHNGKGAQFVPHAHVHILGKVSADRSV